MMCEHKDGVMERRVLAPPAVPRALSPGAGTASEHVAAHHRRSDVLEPPLDDGSARADLAALFAVQLPECLEREEPLMELHPALADRILLALVRPGDIAVE